MKATAVAATYIVSSASATTVARPEGATSAFLARTSRFFFGLGGGSGEPVHYGDTLCPCIGFDRIDGETVVIFAEEENASAAGWLPPVGMAPSPSPAFAPSPPETGMQVSYPADLGAHCEPWDKSRHPKCKGERSDPDWCGQPWCYVDPCRCKIPILPKESEYVPDARYRGGPIFYSYATCGGKNTFSGVVTEAGNPECRCIGLDNVPGSTNVKIDGRKVAYPGDLGSTCDNWDRNTHPLCKGSDAPKWCFQRWCYVDPCSCNIDELPKVTMYLPKASFQAKSLYYSYETCGSKDFFTKEHNKGACTNQESKESCLDLKLASGSNKCAWTGKVCLGWEIVEHPLCKHMASRFESMAVPVRPAAWIALAAALLAAVAP